MPKAYIFKDLYYENLPSDKTLKLFIENLISYTFTDNPLLIKAFTSKSISTQNYEILEFLGDSILDIIILSTVYPFDNFTSYQLSSIKQLLVCNQNLCCISIMTGLSKHLKIDLKFNNDKILKGFKIEDIDVIRDNIFSMQIPKHFGDIFESLIGALFLDCKNIKTTSMIITTLMKKQILYVIKNLSFYLQIQKFSSLQFSFISKYPFKKPALNRI